MASTNKDLVDNAMDVLRSGLVPFVAWEFNGRYGSSLGTSCRRCWAIQST